MTTLLEVDDADFCWMAGNAPSVRGDLRLPPGGVDEPAVLEHVRSIVRGLREAQCSGGWMIVSAGEVVGLCGYKAPPSAGGDVEVGYGIAASRRRRGHATAAVALLLAKARLDPAVRAVIADTNLDNVASQRVLSSNGFHDIGRVPDPQDGRELIRWRVAT